MTNYKQKYEDLCRDIDLAIAGQKEGETKIVLQNIKERNRGHNDESIISLLGERDTTFNEEVTKYCREHNIYDTNKIGEVYSIATHFLYWQSHKPAEWSEEDEKNSSY